MKTSSDFTQPLPPKAGGFIHQTIYPPPTHPVTDNGLFWRLVNVGYQIGDNSEVLAKVLAEAA